MNRDQGTGVVERVIYGVLLGFFMKLVGKGYLSADMAPYLAAGAVSLIGGAYAWWINRPGSLLTAAGNTLPKNATLQITTTPSASPAEKVEAHALADSASEKVVANTTK